MDRNQQNASITRQTEADRRMNAAADRAIEKHLRQTARENATYEQDARTLAIALIAVRHIINKSGWTEATRITGLSEAQLRVLPRL